MSSSTTFFDIPLSSTFCADLEKSLWFLDWVLASGLYLMNVNLSIKDSLPFDLLLGCDWYLYCPDSLPGARFLLTSGILDFAPNCERPPIQGCLM
ncbi:hypothetical protein B0H14DRAFT_3873689, partial [Mycena olivaceomarginata]